MSEDEVTSKSLDSFTSFQLEWIEFLRYGQDNMLSVMKDTKMSGDAVFEVAGQGTLPVGPRYMIVLWLLKLTYMYMYHVFNMTVGFTV